MYTITLRAVGLGILLSAAVPTWAHAIDAETARLEAAALCQTIPHLCTADPPTAPPARRARTAARKPVTPAVKKPNAPGTDLSPGCDLDIARYTVSVCDKYPVQCQSAHRCLDNAAGKKRGHSQSPPLGYDFYASSRPKTFPAVSDPITNMVHGCANAAGIDPHGVINPSQMQTLTSCVDRRIRR